MDVSASSGDPGWRPALKGMGRVLIPAAPMMRAQRQLVAGGRLDGLVALRSAFLTFVLSIGLIGIVVAFLADDGGRPSMSGEAGAALVTVAGISSVLGIRLLRRSLDCRSDASLAESYRSRFFLRVAFAEGVTLLGFVTFFLTANPAMYPLALVFWAVGFASLAPTAGHLEADQRALVASGCGRPLVAALRLGGQQPPG